MKILCVGAGPAGLYFAICAKLRNPDHGITVVERGPEGVTYGWGFGFWDDLLDGLYRGDPVTAGQIEAASGIWNGVEVHIGDQSTAYLGGYGLSMGRHRLLDILVARARELGVELHFDRELTDLDGLDADLVVAADGINSTLRAARAGSLGTTVVPGRNYYSWLGTDKVFTEFRYVFEKTSAGWIWLHCYYLDQHRGTCIVECPPETWHGLGFDRLGQDEYLEALREIFARHLDGHKLISQSREGPTVSGARGRQVSNARWYSANVALLGDAAHSTHFSIGSGTRLALGDSIALAEKVTEHGDDVAAALRAYDAERRPLVDAMQRQALRSMRWLEAAPELLDDPGLDPVQFAHALATRLGNRDARWRYYLHLATQVPSLRAARGKLTAARRARRRRLLSDRTGATRPAG